MARESRFQSIVVVGTGYVGLPLALLFAKAGFDVLGVDIDERAVRGINSGDLHISEPGLPELIRDPEVRKHLRAATRPEAADVFIIAVPTPLKKPQRVAEMSMVEDAARAIAPLLKKGNLVLLESTVPPRTCRDLLTPILEQSGLKVGKDILLAHCPERVLPGGALHEIINNDRIVGGIDEASTKAGAEVYRAIVQGEVVETDDITAEMCKLMENTYRDVNIALANELALVAEDLGIDINRAIDIANRHPRVKMLKPGIGVGGHCIPIDPWFITQVDPAKTRLIPVARHINDERPHLVAQRVRRAVREIADPKILCVGATYKPDVADLRESPALEIVHLLKEDGYRVEVWDPIVAEMSRPSLQDRVKAGVDLIVVLVGHQGVVEQCRATGVRLLDATT